MNTTVKILRDLWRLRVAVAVVFAVALLVGCSAGFRISLLPPGLHSRQYHVGVASARVFVDTPTSEILDVAPKGSDTLAARATLLANLMVDGVVEDAIAKRAGLHPDELIGIGSTEAVDPSAPKPGPRDYTLTTGVALDNSGDQLPIITIDTRAPDVKGAERLANAAVAGLNGYLDSQAAVHIVPTGRRLRVTGLGPAQAGVAVHGPSHVLAVFLTLLILTIGCAVLLLVPAIFRSWHAASYDEALETYPGEDDFEPDVPLELMPGSPDPDDGDPADDWSAEDWLASREP
jgi:hypothetical protein